MSAIRVAGGLAANGSRLPTVTKNRLSAVLCGQLRGEALVKLDFHSNSERGAQPDPEGARFQRVHQSAVDAAAAGAAQCFAARA